MKKVLVIVLLAGFATSMAMAATPEEIRAREHHDMRSNEVQHHLKQEKRQERREVRHEERREEHREDHREVRRDIPLKP